MKSRKINLVAGDGPVRGPERGGRRRRPVRRQEGRAGHRQLRPQSLPGLEIGGRIITSNEAIRLDEVPGSVVVLGGGVIGVELASVFTSFGADVTVVEALPRLVPTEDEFCSKLLERAFRRRKIKFKTGVKFTGAEQSDQSVTVSLESGEELEADYLLVAVGRGPNTANAGFEEAGVTMERGFVLTDERLRTNLHERLRRSATSCPACSWPTAGSRRASSWPRTSPG